MEQKGLKGGTKSYGCATGGGGGRLPPGYGHASIQKCSWGEPQTPPPRWRPEGLHRPPPPELAPPFGAPLVLGQKSTSKTNVAKLGFPHSRLYAFSSNSDNIVYHPP